MSMNYLSNDSTNFIKAWADKIKQMGLTTPAIILLEAHKPLSFVISQFMVLGQPMLNLFFSAHFTDQAIRLFSNRNDLEGLIKELERD